LGSPHLKTLPVPIEGSAYSGLRVPILRRVNQLLVELVMEVFLRAAEQTECNRLPILEATQGTAVTAQLDSFLPEMNPGH